MKLQLCRNYFPKGTNGILYDEQGEVVCYTIELPWRNNEFKKSCIPEGIYPLYKRDPTVRFKYPHILVGNTKPRTAILFHRANNALEELEGCIAPVTKLTGEGLGNSSTPMVDKLVKLVYEAIDKGEKVYLEIKENK